MPGRRQRWRADGPRRRTVLVVLGLLGTGALGVSAAAGAGGRAPADRFTRDADRGDQGRPGRPSRAPGASRRPTPRCSSAPTPGRSTWSSSSTTTASPPTRAACRAWRPRARPSPASRSTRTRAPSTPTRTTWRARRRRSSRTSSRPSRLLDVGSSFRVVYGGIAMKLPANQVRKVLGVDGVVAVQRDSLEQPQTDVTPQFLGATNIYPQLGGRARAGQGVTVGILDTGITPQTRRSATRAAGAAGRPVRLRLRRRQRPGPGSAGRLQRQADRRARLPEHLPLGHRRSPRRVLRQHDEAMLGPRRRRGRHAHRVDRGR